MLVQNLKLVVRNLQKKKFYAISTIIGFASALVLFTLILSTIVYEYDTDRFQDENVYRVKMVSPFGFKMDIRTFYELPIRLRNDFPEMEYVTHLHFPGDCTFDPVRSDEKIPYKEKRVFYADEFFFKVFNYRLKYGDAVTSLTEPRSILISEERALTYFGTSDVLNQSIEFNNEVYKITGVLEKEISNSHLNFDFLLSYSSLPLGKNRLDHGGFTYFSLMKSNDLHELVDKLNRQSPNLFTSSRTQTNPGEKTFDVESIYTCYFNTDYSEYLSVVNKSRDKKSLVFFFIITSTILLVAIINFLIFYFSKILFATKEIGIKRALGITNLWALAYFALEAFVMLFISLLLAITVSVVIVPYTNVWLSTSVPDMFLLNYRIIILLISVIVILSVLFGAISFKFFYGINTVKLLKESSNLVSSRSYIIYVVIAIQILFSTAVILSFLSLENQMRFARQQPLGYQIDNLIEIDLSGLSPSYNPHVLKSALITSANVSSASICIGGPFSGRGQRDMEFKDEQVNISFYDTDEDFISTLDMEMISGENFDGNTSADSTYLLINESAAAFFKYSENTNSFELPNNVPGVVTGVVKDFHYSSFKGKISPVFIRFARFEKLGPDLGKLIVRLNSINPETLASIKVIWLKTVGDVPFNYTVLANDYSSFYTRDMNEIRLLSFAAFIILVITCLGVIGVSHYSSSRRLKEFSIRRVFGASSSKIYFDWMKGLLIAVMVSFGLSIPISFFLTERWLDEFVYKAPISISPAIITLGIISLAVFSSSFYNIYAVMKGNPSEILRQD